MGITIDKQSDYLIDKLSILPRFFKNKYRCLPGTQGARQKNFPVNFSRRYRGIFHRDYSVVKIPGFSYVYRGLHKQGYNLSKLRYKQKPTDNQHDKKYKEKFTKIESVYFVSVILHIILLLSVMVLPSHGIFLPFM